MNKKILTKEECINLYYNKNKSFRDISSICGYSDNYVRQWFKKYNIKSRTRSESCILRNKLKPQSNLPELLREKAKILLLKGYKHFNTSMSSDGYKRLYIPLKGWKKEHIYLWELKNGKIKDDLIIHHINENKLDNRLINLKLMTRSEHMKHHEHKRDTTTGRFVN